MQQPIRSKTWRKSLIGLSGITVAMALTLSGCSEAPETGTDELSSAVDVADVSTQPSVTVDQPSVAKAKSLPAETTHILAYSVFNETRGSGTTPDHFIGLTGDAVGIVTEGAHAFEIVQLGSGKVAFRREGSNAYLTTEDKLAGYAAFSSPGDLPDRAMFFARTPLENSDPSFASFESAAHPGEYLRHAGFRLRLDPVDASSGSMDRRDATFLFEAANRVTDKNDVELHSEATPLTVDDSTVKDFMFHIWQAPDGIIYSLTDEKLYGIYDGKVQGTLGATFFNSCADRTENANGKAYLLSNGSCGDILKIENNVATISDPNEINYTRMTGEDAQKIQAMIDAYEAKDDAGSLADKAKTEADAIQNRDNAAQKQTAADVSSLGDALMSWLTDAVSGNPTDMLGEFEASKSTLGFARGHIPTSGKDYKKLSYGQMVKLLHPLGRAVYMEDIPKTDGWGHEYEYYVNENVLSSAVVLIRSPGKDGVFSGNFYQTGMIPAENYDDDIVWADGYMIRWPENPTPKPLAVELHSAAKPLTIAEPTVEDVQFHVWRLDTIDRYMYLDDVYVYMFDEIPPKYPTPYGYGAIKSCTDPTPLKTGRAIIMGSCLYVENITSDTITLVQDGGVIKGVRVVGDEAKKAEAAIKARAD